MSLAMRILLIIGACWMLTFVLRSVRRSRMRTEESFFWIAFAVLMVILAAFTDIIGTLSGWIGVESPANLIFLMVIFLLILKIFALDRKAAKLQHQLTELIQRKAIEGAQEREEQ